MTLCIAWIRQEDKNQELVFATDSMLTGGGETWKHGVKLFELPRKDCLLCFAGETQKAYPLILNLISSLKFDHKLIDQHTSIDEVLEYLCNLFTNLISNLNYSSTDKTYNPYTAAEFIFGGWDWKQQLLVFWKIYFSSEEKKFLYQGYNSDDQRAFIMIGDYLEDAEKLLMEELKNNEKHIKGSLDMEPFMVLSKMARNKENYYHIDGALQIAKVYQSGSTEFFGIMWQSLDGKHTFLGRELNPYIKPHISFIDPDSGIIQDLELPQNISSLNTIIYGNEESFIKECYLNGELKPNLTSQQKEMLLAIFKDNSYKSFLNSLKNSPESEDVKTNE
jgi:hypothetical protein